MHAVSIKRQLRGMNSEKLGLAAARTDEVGALAKSEIERRKLRRERKST